MRRKEARQEAKASSRKDSLLSNGLLGASSGRRLLVGFLRPCLLGLASFLGTKLCWSLVDSSYWHVIAFFLILFLRGSLVFVAGIGSFLAGRSISCQCFLLMHWGGCRHIGGLLGK